LGASRAGAEGDLVSSRQVTVSRGARQASSMRGGIEHQAPRFVEPAPIIRAANPGQCGSENLINFMRPMRPWLVRTYIMSPASGFIGGLCGCDDRRRDPTAVLGRDSHGVRVPSTSVRSAGVGTERSCSSFGAAGLPGASSAHELGDVFSSATCFIASGPVPGQARFRRPGCRSLIGCPRWSCGSLLACAVRASPRPCLRSDVSGRHVVSGDG
jgi:hypothetical protein